MPGVPLGSRGPGCLSLDWRVCNGGLALELVWDNSLGGFLIVGSGQLAALIMLVPIVRAYCSLSLLLHSLGRDRDSCLPRPSS